MAAKSWASIRLKIAAVAGAASIVSGFTFTPAARCTGSTCRGAAWTGKACTRSRSSTKMVVTDVADIAMNTDNQHENEYDYAYEGEELPFEMIPRFERLKANYRGVMSALDEEDLEDVDDTYLKFENMLDEHKVSFRKGEVLQGRVLQVGQDGALIDIGAKATAYMPSREVSLTEVDSLESVIGVDEEAEFMVISDENDMGQVQVSIRRIQFEKAWEEVQELQASDAVLEGPVVGVNRGGAIVLVKGLRGFLPGSHMSGATPKEDIIGKVLSFKFLEVNAEANKLVVSHRRAVLEKEMKELSRGDVVEGEVKAIKPYGAFVEIRGMSGLLHISQISFDRVENLPSILDIGMTVKCMIIDHDKVNGRIALSTKTLEPEPGDMIKNPQKVYEMAEATAAKYHERMEHERKAREDAAKSIVMGLGDGLDTFDSDVLAGIADGIESVLKAPPQRDE